jgi:hypothetical protein
VTRTLESVVELALRRCELSGRCSDSQSPGEHHEPPSGLLEPAAGEVAWTGYLDAEVDENGELRLRGMERAERYRAAHAKLPDSIAAMGETLASLRPAWAAAVEPFGAPAGFGAALARARAGLIAAGVTVDSRPLVGAHPPLPRWTLRCDRPSCNATLEATGTTDSDARRYVTLAAETRGWQISRWRDVPVDLCPEHREEGWAEGPPRVRLESGITDGRRKR